MKRRKPIAILLLSAALVAVTVPTVTNGASASARVPTGFFGVAPQGQLTPEDASYMKAGEP